MAANVTTHATPSLRSARTWRPLVPGPRTIAVILALAALAIVAWMPQRVAHAAHAACTIGAPEQASCGDALVLLGYP